MGCDIHFFAERRENERWVTCDRWEEEDGFLSVPYEEHLYSERNYDVFAMLANVRNGKGFGGGDTGEGFVPLALPRGIPEDCCPEYKRHWEELGEHNPSYCTVAELLAYDWTRETVKRGILDLSEYLRWRPWYQHYKEWPRTWSGGISGPGIVIHEAAEIDRALSGLDLWAVSRRREDDAVCHRLHVDVAELNHDDRNRVHVSVQWGTPYARAARTFLSETMPRLWRLGPPDQVRCLFYFDS